MSVAQTNLDRGSFRGGQKGANSLSAPLNEKKTPGGAAAGGTRRRGSPRAGKLRIYVELPLSVREKEDFRKRLLEADLHFAEPFQLTESDKEAFLASEIAFGSCSKEWLGETSKLRWLQLPSVGFDAYASLNWKNDTRFAVTSLRGLSAQSVAETCLAGILYFCRGLDRLRHFQAGREWRKEAVRAEIDTLSGKRVLIAGAGTIAQSLRGLLAPFSCDITLYGRTKSHADIDRLAELDAILPQADILCSFLPETESTRQLFNAARMARLKPGAIFVNAGRGSVLDEEALYDAIETGRLRGAVLDVTAQEPLPANHKFWGSEKILLTQHTAGGRRDECVRLIDFFMRNLTNYLEGRPLLNPVDWDRGY